MKKIYSTLLCLCLLFGTIGTETFAQVASESKDFGITMTVYKLTGCRITFLVSYSGGRVKGELSCNTEYRLERWNGDCWVQVPYLYDDVTVLSAAYPLEQNAIQLIEHDWHSVYGPQFEGRYRIAKDFLFIRSEDDFDLTTVYAEFVIAENHDCESKDKDSLCDTCLVLIHPECSDEDRDNLCDTCAAEYNLFRVVGDAECMGSWRENSDLGRMKEYKPGVFKKTFKDLAPGVYRFKITQNGRWDQCWGDNTGGSVNGNICVDVEETTDLTVTFTVKGYTGVISVKGDSIETQTYPVEGIWLDGKGDGLFRVVGNAEWMGDMVPYSDAGLMTKRSSGHYVKTFRNVPSGSYELRITESGKWILNGTDQIPVCRLTVEQEGDVTVEIVLQDGTCNLTVDGPTVQSANIEYYDAYTPKSETTYRVIGNASWMGAWNPSAASCDMTQVSPGVFRKEYKNVSPGDYEFKIVKNGDWCLSWGNQGENYVFNLEETMDLTVDFTIHEGEGVISVYGTAVEAATDIEQQESMSQEPVDGTQETLPEINNVEIQETLPEIDNAEIQETLPKIDHVETREASSGRLWLLIGIVAVLLPACGASLLFVIHKKKKR